MKLEDVDLGVLRQVVNSLRSRRSFRTKEVSKHAQMMAVHHALQGERQYHSMVGRVLQRHAVALGIRLCEDATRSPHGELWEWVGGERA